MKMKELYTQSQKGWASVSLSTGLNDLHYYIDLIIGGSLDDGDVSIIIFMVSHVPRTIKQHFWKLQIQDQLSACWARNVLILCNNSFFTLSGTRAAR